jgi:endo-1,4-beta-D-glucanase Y
MTVRRVLFALVALAFSACAKPSDMGGGSGGTTGSGGSGSGGSSSSTGGSGATLPDFLSHGPYPFPQSKTSGSCMLTSNSNAASATQSAYNSWKSSFVTSNGAPSGALRVQDPQNITCSGNGSSTQVSNGTVSEGMGYGMLAAVYMNDQSTFDQLLAYVNAHADANGLMNWCITSSGSTAGAGSATDADEDMAWSLLMAAAQWSSVDYYTAAKAMINAMYGHSLAGDGTLSPGDAWGGTTIYPDYFSPAYYRLFAKVGSASWGTVVIDRNYTILSKVSGPHGLIPNQSDSTTYSTSMNYGYDSCRGPWRIAMDYCFNGEQRALTYLQLVGPFFDGIGASSIGDGYTNSGSATQNNHNMAFIGTAGTAGMAGWPNLLNGAFSFGVNGAGDNAYFTNSLRVVTMLMMSGNLLDYSQQ